MLRSFYAILIFTLSSSLAMAQSGTIKGNIKDEKTGEGIIGANVVLEGTTQGASTDLEGNFTITKVKAGKHNLVITYVSYRTKNIPGVEVYPDQSTVVNTAIQEDVQELESVVVTAQRQTNTDISVITELKKADLVAVGISSQMIQMSQDRDAAQVVRRIPGVTIVGNRFVNVRGLSERYSTVLLNGIIAPSTEVDSKAFAFDLIPSNMVDRMLVFKSGSAELPGEFAGADINIFTKNVVDENYTSLSVSGSYRFQSTGENFSLSQEKSKTDWLGYDNKTRVLPTAFPSEDLRSLSIDPTDQNIAKLTNATKMLPNTWGTRNFNALPDFRANFDMARSIHLGSKRLDNITSVSYAVTNQKLQVEQNFYDTYIAATGENIARYRYTDERFTQTNRIGVISNFTFAFNPSHRIEFRNFFNQQAQNQATLRSGTENAAGMDVYNQAFNYNSRGIYSGQLSGKHAFSDRLNFNWIFGYGNTRANQPDYRRIRSQRLTGTEDPFAVVIPPGASAFDAGRFYSELNENILTAAGNLDIKLNPSADESKQSKIITGYYLEEKNRSFGARWMSYKWMNSSVIDLSLLNQPFDKLFVPENLGTKFILEEGTNLGPDSYDRYTGKNRLMAGYAGIVTPFAEKFRLTSGLRVEYNHQEMFVYYKNVNKIKNVDNPLTIPMPFFNLSYNFTEKSLLRVAYSRTVNRPVFRELAPFNYYDFDRNANITGNPELTTARIHNVDLRWELYPSKSENISLGVFYKNFKNPIEQRLLPGGNLFYSYFNAKAATNYGAEIEVRKSLDNITSNPFLSRLTFVFNGALIKSTIQVPDDPKYDNLVSNRAMQGQSPYVANASIFYNNAEKGWQFSAMYNVFGKRIYAVGDKTIPNQYEMPRNQIDLTITKQITPKFEVKLGIQDLLNQKYRLMQDSDGDKKIGKNDAVVQSYRWGQYATLGINWRF